MCKSIERKVGATIGVPERISHCAALSVGWGTNDPNQPLSLQQVQNYWYHWYMATDRGAALVYDERRKFTRYIWSIWNPDWQISDAEFEATARPRSTTRTGQRSSCTPNRVRWGLAPTDPALHEIEERLKSRPQIAVPTLVIHGGADPCNGPSTSEGKEHFFAGAYERVVLPGVGHFPQRQASEDVARLLVPFLKLREGKEP
jgi:pimeloyl-ACP methyl ester carboxylesterase